MKPENAAPAPKVPLYLTAEQRIELERVVLDEDGDAAISLLRELRRQLKIRDDGPCGDIFAPGGG